MPFHQRIPKLRGFKNPFRVEYQAINLDSIEESGLTDVSPETLLAKGLVGKNSLVKILGRGEVTRAGEREGPRLLRARRGGDRGCRREHREAAPAVCREASCQRQRSDEPLTTSIHPRSNRGTPDHREPT
jgi:hypothetical protein